MSRGHSYAQLPVTEAHEESSASTSTVMNNPSSLLSNLPRLAPSSGYSRINEDEIDEIEELQDLSRSRVDGSTSTAETTIPLDNLQSSSSSSGPGAQTAASNTGTNGAAGAAFSRPKFPAAAGARRMIQQTVDGVFSNLSAKPRVEQPHQEELPPPYKSAAMDQSPMYFETTVVAPGYMEDEVLVDGLPVGGSVGFVWNMIISTSFQFVGFFLTYLLHTSHATKNGSKAGLGITFLSMGTQMMSGRTEMDAPDDDSDTGYMGNVGESMRSVKEYLWLSYFLVLLGAGIMLHSGLEFARAKRTEMVINATSSARSGEAAMIAEDESVV
ncbi:hypothetical protein BGX34_012055 [Mortierella sp. NVP85]|nr:hypothetical protein BGX34_012055 [Mortierella sp. NVP85]